MNKSLLILALFYVGFTLAIGFSFSLWNEKHIVFPNLNAFNVNIFPCLVFHGQVALHYPFSSWGFFHGRWVELCVALVVEGYLS